MKEFLGMGGYQRVPEGFLSWQHLLFVGSLLALMFVLSIWLGKRNRTISPERQNRPLIYSAFLIDGIELIKIIGFCVRDGSLEPISRCLPLFLCSIALIAIPLAAFSKGVIREAGFVKRSKTYGRTFEPTLTREEYFAQFVFSHRCKPDMEELIRALLCQEEITEEERARIREILM